MKTRLAVAAVLSCIAIASPRTQSLDVFTAEDMLKVANATVLDFSDDGRRVAIGARKLADNAFTDHRRYGDPTYYAASMVELLIIDTKSGAIERPAKGLLNIRQAAWTRTGSRLGLLTASETPDGLPVTALWIYDADKKSLTEVPKKKGAEVAANSELTWTADDARLFVALRNPADDAAAQKEFQELVRGPVVVQSSTKPMLAWDAVSRNNKRRSLAEIDPASGTATAVLPIANLTSYQLARDGSFVTYLEDTTDKTNYDVIFGTDNALKLSRGGQVSTLIDARTLKTTNPRWSDDGRLLAYADKGEVFVQRIDEAKARSLTPKPKADDTAAADKKEEAESFSLGPIARDGSKMIVTSKKGWYVVNTTTGSRDRVLTLDDKNEEKNPKLSIVSWTPAGDALLVQYGEPDRWDRGFSRLDMASKQLTSLVKDRNLYQNFRLSRDGSTLIFQRSDGDHPADLYAADPDMKNIRKLTDLNPWIAKKAVPTSELVSYRDSDGKLLYGVLRYPVGYQKGKKYPTIFELYETFFDNGFNARATFLAGQGYAVFNPSVNLVVGRPRESWAKGVTSAANRLIDMGVSDPDKLGVQGTSYGGYATVLLLTETDRFNSAVNVSGKVDMVSFYTDSERMGVRNTHAPEKSQDRIGGTLWEFPERYIDHSAIFRLDRVKTPLLTISGDQDPNVPANQSRELYYAMRRLGREVEWVRYANGGHRPPNSVSESIDFENRMLAWHDKHLKSEKPSTTTQQQ